MNLEGTRRVMETNSAESANEYLRFGWKLINQYLAHAGDQPGINYVLASVRTLEDTKQVVTLTDHETVNCYLKAGWRLIEKYVSARGPSERREETLNFVMAWQDPEEPVHPEAVSARRV